MASARNEYAGLSLQQAQEKIIEDTIEYQESPDDAIPTFADFIDLPPRSLKDYYATIQHPLSLKSLQRAVRGTAGSRGRSSLGGGTPFLTWPQFEKEISYIWVNTFEYNVEDSEIYARGKQLETFVKKALKEAKQAVADSTGAATGQSGPKIRLNLTRKAPHGSPTEEANSPIANGTPTNGASRSSKRLRTGTPTSAGDRPGSAKSLSDTVASPAPSSTAPTKTEEVSESITANPPASRAPSTPSLVPSGMLPPSTAAGNVSQQVPAAYTQALAHGPHAGLAALAPGAGLDYSRFRTTGQSANGPLITNVVFASHPGLNLETQYLKDMRAWERVKQPHFTFHVPGACNYVQIKPNLAEGLINRQHKMFVMINNQTLQAMPMVPGHSIDPLRPLFETRLEPGTSRIDIQIRATLPRDAPRGPNGEDYEDEYWVICPHLRRI